MYCIYEDRDIKNQHEYSLNEESIFRILSAQARFPESEIMAVAGLRYQMHCMVQGGDVLHGALMGLTCFAAGESVVGLGKRWGAGLGVKALQTGIVAVAGGTVAELGGGNFANGAMTAAFAFLFNHLGHTIYEQSEEAFLACLEMADNANSLVGSKDDDDYCNWFLRDQMQKVGIYPENRGTISAGEWGDPNIKNIGGWIIVDVSYPVQNGDIMAFKKRYSNATGHCAIVYIETDKSGSTSTDKSIQFQANI